MDEEARNAIGSDPVDPWIYKDARLVGEACTRWLDARGLNAVSWHDRLRTQFANAIEAKKIRRQKREYNESCKVWDDEETE